MDQRAVEWEVFIAHSSADTEVAESLFGLLSHSGVKVFLDTHSVLPGDDWDLALRDAQRKSLMTVVLVSERTDEAFYQREEIASAIALSRQDPAHRVIPIFIGSLPTADTPVPYGLRLKHGMSATDGRSLKLVASRIVSLLVDLKQQHAAGESTDKKAGETSRQQKRASEAKTLIELEKVDLLHWERLNASERRRFYEQFLALQPISAPSEWMIAPTSRQAELNSRSPMNLEPLVRLFDSFHLDSSRISFPFDEGAVSLLKASASRLVGLVASMARDGFEGPQLAALNNLNEYLRCTDREPGPTNFRDLDLILVFGARTGHKVRARKAHALYRQALKHPRVLLIGNRPATSEQSKVPITEAHAIYHYIRSVERLNIAPKDISLELRARSLRESISLILPELQKERLRVHEPLSVVLVCAPFAMRRLIHCAEHALQGFHHVVGSLYAAPSTEVLDLAAFLALQSDDAQRRFWAHTYINEYVKLILGRCVAEY